MKYIDKLRSSTKPLLSIEVVPPRKGKSIDKVLKIVDLAMPFSPGFINVTYHQSHSVKIKKNGKEMLQRVQKRPGSFGI